MPSTDFLQLNTTEMFAKIRASLPAERQQTLNLLECKDDLLYAWDSQDSSLLVINWRAAQVKGFQEVKYQTLIPSGPQNFNIERLLASNEGSLIALAGPRGVTVLELPRRWGANGQFMEGKEKITCRSSNLDAHFFHNNPHLEVRQLRWHPDSPTDSHLLVLLSDNTIRVYDNATLRHVWQVGPTPTKASADQTNVSNTSVPTVYALGEVAVDFDIGPAMKTGGGDDADETAETMDDKSELGKSLKETDRSSFKKSERIEWPVVILRENGNVYVLMAGLDSDRPRLQGPLTITPQTSDNYGTDSCALLIIPSLPLTLVIAESTGKLHHALLLEAENAENSFNEVDSSLLIHPAEWVVHVMETVELELGLPKHEPASKAYHCPLHLKRDFINELRYFAYHNTGLHVVTVNFIAELQRYLEESKVVTDLSFFSVPSSAEYILCTKIASSESAINPVLGFVLLQMPSGVVLLLGSGQVISLKLIINPKLLLSSETAMTKGHDDETPAKSKADSQLAVIDAEEPPFIDHIKSLLKRNVTQPILSLDKSSAAPSTLECYELLTQAIEVLRSEYIKRQELVRAAFNKRLNTIRLRKEQQRRDIEYLERERETIREMAHQLAERFEEISDQQEEIGKKCQDLVRQANTCLPSNVIAEKEFADEVTRINNATKNLSNTLQKAKENMNKQSYHIQKYQENSQQKAFVLPEKQERTIKEILMQITAEVDNQIKDVKRLNKVVGLST